MTEWLEQNGFIPIPTRSLTDDEIQVLKSIMGEPLGGGRVMLKKKYYDGMQVQSIITEELNNGELIMQILKRFADAPSADVRENVKGKWGNSGEYPWDKCSVCGHCVNPYEDDYFFCPNCGADMKG